MELLGVAFGKFDGIPGLARVEVAAAVTIRAESCLPVGAIGSIALLNDFGLC